MSNLSPRMVLALPAADIELARRLSVLFDPGGASDTWIEERQDAGYVWTETPVYAQYEALVRGRDPEQWHAFLTQAASAKGIEPLTRGECAHLCESMLIDSEFAEVREAV